MTSQSGLFVVLIVGLEYMGEIVLLFSFKNCTLTLSMYFMLNSALALCKCFSIRIRGVFGRFVRVLELIFGI